MRQTLWAVPLFALFLSGCGGAPDSTPAATTLPSHPAPVQKFSDQPYAKNAYLISSDTLSPDATTALAGFKMSKQTFSDGTTRIDLKALEPQYHDQSYTLQPGEQLYFIDQFLGDDQGGAEANIGDDTAVVVNGQGNVVRPPEGF